MWKEETENKKDDVDSTKCFLEDKRCYAKGLASVKKFVAAWMTYNREGNKEGGSALHTLSTFFQTQICILSRTLSDVPEAVQQHTVLSRYHKNLKIIGRLRDS